MTACTARAVTRDGRATLAFFEGAVDGPQGAGSAAGPSLYGGWPRAAMRYAAATQVGANDVGGSSDLLDIAGEQLQILLS